MPILKISSLNFAFLKRRIKATQKMFFMQQMRIMSKAGVPLTTALKTLQAQTSGRRFKTILQDVSDKIEKGQTLAQALLPYTSDFGELMINMIAAGEAS